MQLVLRCHDGREHLQLVGDYRGSGFIAGGLENQQLLHSADASDNSEKDITCFAAARLPLAEFETARDPCLRTRLPTTRAARTRWFRAESRTRRPTRVFHPGAVRRPS